MERLSVTTRALFQSISCFGAAQASREGAAENHPPEKPVRRIQVQISPAWESMAGSTQTVELSPAGAEETGRAG
jgi:hypothetical protein